MWLFRGQQQKEPNNSRTKKKSGLHKSRNRTWMWKSGPIIKLYIMWKKENLGTVEKWVHMLPPPPIIIKPSSVYVWGRGGVEGFLRVFQVYGCTGFFRFRVQDRGRGCRDLRASSGWPSSLVFAFWASLSPWSPGVGWGTIVVRSIRRKGDLSTAASLVGWGREGGLAQEAAATAARPAAAVELLPSSCVAVLPAASVAVDLLRCRLRLQVVAVVVASLQSPILCYGGRNYSVGSGVGK